MASGDSSKTGSGALDFDGIVSSAIQGFEEGFARDAERLTELRALHMERAAR